VRISKPFFMNVYEVTQEQYEAVMGGNPSNFKGARNPVEWVSWEDATEFCRRLSQKTGRTVRLPTEAEWEYACRAGTTTAFHCGQTISTRQANCRGDYTRGKGHKGLYRGKTLPVGAFPSNAWGLYDMCGNVQEWCQDLYGDYPSGTAVDPTGPASGCYPVTRGGSWFANPWYCRSASRSWDEADDRTDDVGFRVVCPTSVEGRPAGNPSD
jgi:formylglycine-generating enzyme required for sulfatase activity